MLNPRCCCISTSTFFLPSPSNADIWTRNLLSLDEKDAFEWNESIRQLMVRGWPVFLRRRYFPQERECRTLFPVVSSIAIWSRISWNDIASVLLLRPSRAIAWNAVIVISYDRSLNPPLTITSPSAYIHDNMRWLWRSLYHLSNIDCALLISRDNCSSRCFCDGQNPWVSTWTEKFIFSWSAGNPSTLSLLRCELQVWSSSLPVRQSSVRQSWKYQYSLIHT